MARLEYFLASESVAIDRVRNSVSIFHVINELQLEEIPSELHKLSLISCWMFDEDEIRRNDEFQLRFRIELPDGESKDFRANISPGQSRFQYYVFVVENVPVQKTGDMMIRAFLNDTETATHVIAVSVSS